MKKNRGPRGSEYAGKNQPAADMAGRIAELSQLFPLSV
jgi:hypothetical protein